ADTGPRPRQLLRRLPGLGVGLADRRGADDDFLVPRQLLLPDRRHARAPRRRRDRHALPDLAPACARLAPALAARDDRGLLVLRGGGLAADLLAGLPVSAAWAAADAGRPEPVPGRLRPKGGSMKQILSLVIAWLVVELLPRTAEACAVCTAG